MICLISWNSDLFIGPPCIFYVFYCVNMQITSSQIPTTSINQSVTNYLLICCV